MQGGSWDTMAGGGIGDNNLITDSKIVPIENF